MTVCVQTITYSKAALIARATKRLPCAPRPLRQIGKPHPGSYHVGIGLPTHLTYETAHPGVKVEFDYLENQPFKAKLPTLLQSKGLPSAFRSLGGGVDTRTVSSGICQDITKPVTEGGFKDASFSRHHRRLHSRSQDLRLAERRRAGCSLVNCWDPTPARSSTIRAPAWSRATQRPKRRLRPSKPLGSGISRSDEASRRPRKQTVCYV